MHKVLIAGSTGFLGSHLEERLRKQPEIVLKTINRSSGDYKFSDLKQISEDFDHVYVIFSILPDASLSFADYKEVNVDLTRRIIEKFPKARFIFSSTISIYENASQKPSDELTISNEIYDYAKSKLEAEILFEKYNSICLRLSSLYGPGMKENTFLPIALNSALDKKQIKLIGDTQRRQNYTYVDDVVDFLVAAANSKHNGVFNAVNDRSYSNEELALIIQKLVPSSEIIKEESQHKSYSYEISNEKWKNCFNQGSKISLEEGLRRYLKHLQG